MSLRLTRLRAEMGSDRKDSYYDGQPDEDQQGSESSQRGFDEEVHSESSHEGGLNYFQAFSLNALNMFGTGQHRATIRTPRHNPRLTRRALDSLTILFFF